MHEDPCWHHVCEEGSTAASDAVDLPLTRIRANILMWIPDSCFFFFFFLSGTVGRLPAGYLPRLVRSDSRNFAPRSVKTRSSTPIRAARSVSCSRRRMRMSYSHLFPLQRSSRRNQNKNLSVSAWSICRLCSQIDNSLRRNSRFQVIFFLLYA